MQVDMDRFGKNFKELLKEKGISQIKFSELSGIHRMTVNDWATGKALPCAEYLVLMAKKLDVTVEDLMKNVVKE